MQAALAEAQQGFDEGGIPIGSVIVVDGQIIGRGHNRRVQLGNPILHHSQLGLRIVMTATRSLLS